MARKKQDSGGTQQRIENVIIKPLDQVMHDSMMPYAEYVIMQRALPRVEDGLKPVQRRILITMHELGLSPDKPHRKSARVVGDALGKYHPHGDTSVYDAMVRMAQPFNMRAMLVDGHGNFGSVDGDSAAAMRYTEVRLTPLSLEILRDIDKDTVDYHLNFDDTLKEPEILPGRFPNLLVNGSTGIAVGMATNIPPHNLKEVIEGVILLLDKPKSTVEDLMEMIPGPDFPTGGSIMGREMVIKAYLTGKGKIKVRAKVEIEKQNGGKILLVIKELPYQVNKANMLAKILKLQESRRSVLNEISDIRDESDRSGMRAVIELKKGADHQKVLNYLYKYSDLEVTFGANMVAIADGKPRLLGLKVILEYYIIHQKNVVTRRTRYNLEKAEQRAHILDALIEAINCIDEVIALIRLSKNAAEARSRLMKAFNFTSVQAQAILDMRLQRLTSLEIVALRKEYEELMKKITYLKSILKSERKLIGVIKKELSEISEKYADERRTIIEDDAAVSEIKTEDLVFVEDIVILINNSNEIKCVAKKVFDRFKEDMQSDDGKKAGYITHVIDTATDRRIMLFTAHGDNYQFNGTDIPISKWRDKFQPLTRMLNGFSHTDMIVGATAHKKDKKRLFRFVTRKGFVKVTAADEYLSRTTKIKAIGLQSDDLVIDMTPTNGSGEVIMVSVKGMSIRFSQSEVNTVGRSARGVKGMTLSKGDYIIGAFNAIENGDVVVLTDNGFGKRTKSDAYPVQGRAGKGTRTLQFYKNKANGVDIVFAGCYGVHDKLHILTDAGDNIIVVNDISLLNRDSRGSAVVDGNLDTVFMDW